jgi:hypothetical protein
VTPSYLRVYQANRSRGHEAAAEQRDLLLRHAQRIEAEIAVQNTRLDYLKAKAALWDGSAHIRPVSVSAGHKCVSTPNAARSSAMSWRSRSFGS